MGEYGGWVTLGDKSSKSPAPNPLEKSGSWLKLIHLTKSELLPSKDFLDSRPKLRPSGRVLRRFTSITEDHFGL